MRLFGIRVRIHPTTPIFFAGIWVFSWQANGREFAFWGLASLLTLFCCVLLHEFGHALMARRLSYGTKDIVIFPFGGIASVKMPRYPKVKDEWLITIAGPAVNAAIVLILWLVLPTHSISWTTTVHSWKGMAEWILAGNIVIAAFNLVPAYPLDGGRLLRATLAGFMSQPLATLIANTISLGIMFALIAFMMVYVHAIVISLFLSFLLVTNFRQQKQYLWDWRASKLPVRDFLISEPYKVLPIIPGQTVGQLRESCQGLYNLPILFAEPLTAEVAAYAFPCHILEAKDRTLVQSCLYALGPTLPADATIQSQLEVIHSSNCNVHLVADSDGKLIGILDKTAVHERLDVLRKMAKATP